VTEISGIPNRGHALTIDAGWEDVAGIALDFAQRFASPASERPSPVVA
jgi:hypothetical protein